MYMYEQVLKNTLGDNCQDTELNGPKATLHQWDSGPFFYMQKVRPHNLKDALITEQPLRPPSVSVYGRPHSTESWVNSVLALTEKFHRASMNSLSSVHISIQHGEPSDQQNEP